MAAAKKAVSKKVVRTRSNGDKVYGPYNKEAEDGKRQIYVIRKPNGKSTSETKARADYEDKTGKKVAKGKEIDHKDDNKNNDSPSNLQEMSKSDNVAKGNRARAKKTTPAKKTTRAKKK